MKRGESDSRLRWAFGLAVLVHAGTLAVLAHLPLAQASGGSFDRITVFGARVPFAGSLVTLVDWPPSGPASPGPVMGVTPQPGPGRTEHREVQPAPPSPRRAEHHAGRGPSRPETPARPSDPAPAPQPTAVTDPAGAEGQGGSPATAGTPNPIGTVPGPERPGGEGGEVPPGPAAGGGGDGNPTGMPAAGGRGDGQSGNGGPATGSPVGNPEGSPGAANAGPPKVEWANPKVLRTVQPVYPESAAANGVEGTVVMKVLVGERGQVVEAEVLRTSHDPRLDKAALTAVRQWRFEPATQDGKAHPVYARTSIRFKLP